MTPKISTGTVSGSTSTASSSPPRRSVTDKRRADQADESQRRRARPSSVSAVDADRRRIDVEHQAEQRRDDDQRQAGGEPMRNRLRQRPPVRAAVVPSSADRACRPRGRTRIAGRAPAGSRAARRARGSPGRCVAESARSGPTANGTSVTTIRKNSAPISAPPPTRTASRMSRTRRAAKAFMPAPVAAASCALSPIGPWLAATIMPPPRRCARISSASAFLAGGVERRGRLVEQPERPFDRDQPRDRQPPLLPGR